MPRLEKLGYGWTHRYSGNIVIDSFRGNLTASIRHADGKVVQYIHARDKVVWSAGAGVNNILLDINEQNGNVSGYQYVDYDRDMIEKYDTSGKLLSITYKTGNSYTLAYNSSSLLQTITDTMGHQLNFAYNAAGRIATIVTQGAGVYTYTYDSNNNLKSVSYPDGKVRTYHYENTTFKNALTGITDENSNRFATWGYDSKGRAVSSQHAGGVENTVLTYNADGSTTVTDARNNASTYGFTTILGATKSTGQSHPCSSGCGASSNVTTYDANGNVTSQTDFSGNVTTYAYDLTRNLETQRVEASDTLEARIISTQWHPGWRLAARIAEPLRLTTLVYNGQPDQTNGNVVVNCASDSAVVNNMPIAMLCKKITHASLDIDGSQGFSATPVGAPRVWSYTYNANRQIATLDGPRIDVNDTTTYVHAPVNGNLLSITNALGQVTQITSHDASGRPLRSVDANGLVTQLTYTPARLD